MVLKGNGIWQTDGSTWKNGPPDIEFQGADHPKQGKENAKVNTDFSKFFHNLNLNFYALASCEEPSFLIPFLNKVWMIA